jgi:hypothetical protein
MTSQLDTCSDGVASHRLLERPQRNDRSHLSSDKRQLDIQHEFLQELQA